MKSREENITRILNFILSIANAIVTDLFSSRTFNNKGKWKKYLLKFNNVLLLGNERKVFYINFEKFKTKHFEVPSKLNRHTHIYSFYFSVLSRLVNIRTFFFLI